MAKPARLGKETHHTVVRAPRAQRLGRPKAPAVIAYVDPAGEAYVALLGLKETAASHLVDTISKGLPFRTFETFVSTTHLSVSDAATLVSIPPRTLTRRKQSGRLAPDESDRLLRASRVIGRAIELFDGDRESAKQWLARPQRALGGATPFQIASTEVGARAVERLVDQLELGIFV